MKYNIVVVCCCTFIFLVACAHQKKVAYDFPPAMPESVRSGYMEICNKGKVLYDINCAKCHNMVVKGKDIIPDFSQEKLTGYELRVANREHEGSMPDTKVTAEELVLISTFLTYKKKVNIPMSSATATTSR